MLHITQTALTEMRQLVPLALTFIPYPSFPNCTSILTFIPPTDNI